MLNLDNLEDIFKNNFEDLNVEPNEKLWKDIKSNLWYSDIQNAFRNFTLQPAGSVWRAIAFRLWFKQFLIYSPATFNVYYLFSIFFIGFSSFYFYNESFEDVPIINDSIKQNTVVLESQNSVLPDREVFRNKEEKINSIENNTENNNTILAVLNNNKEVNIHSEKNNQNEKNSIVREPLLINEEPEEINDFRDYSNLIRLKPYQTSLNSDLKISELQKRDLYNFKNRKLQWSIEGYLTAVNERAIYNVNNNEHPEFALNYKAENPSNSFSGGLLLEAKYKRLSLQTGLSVSKFIDRPSYQTADYIIDTSLVTQIIPGGFYNYFSIPILDLDTYLATGDSVFIMVLDSTFIPQNDTITVQQITAQKFVHYKRTANSYYYVELPLMAGYTFMFGNVHITMRGGIVAGLLTYSEGSIPSPYSEQGTTDIIQDTHCRKLVMSGIGGLEIGYDVTPRISVVTSPIYRFNLNSVLNRNYIVDQRFNSFGLKFGVKYHLR